MIELLTKQGWKLIQQRVKTPIAEIDLLFERDQDVRLVEVKTLSSDWRAFQRISKRQIQKLVLNQIHFSKAWPQLEFSCWIAWVTDEKIEFVEIN